MVIIYSVNDSLVIEKKKKWELTISNENNIKLSQNNINNFIGKLKK